MTATSRSLWVGTYPAPGTTPGSGEGIWQVEIDPDRGTFGQARLVTTATSPSFLALHPSGRTVYAVSETAAGSVAAFRAGQDADGRPALAVSGAVPSGGDDPCHVLALPDTVWVANYGDGVAASLAVDPATGDVVAGGVTAHEGSGDGPVRDRQGGPHAHYVALPAGDAGHPGPSVLVSDLGADVLRRYPAATDGSVDPGAVGDVAARLPAGTGPRHLVPLGDGALAVVGELDARIHVLVPGGDGWVPAASYPVHPGAVAGRDFPAHVTVSADGRRLHVGVRGSDVLAVHEVGEVRGPGGDPVLEHRADAPLGDGAWPRHHAVVTAATGDGELVVVALQGTSELATVRVAATGAAEVVARSAWATPPACILES